ncbi:MAG TPA: extracellular solute-binding protein [Candidatus Nitrosotalea sp.]|nr:extracellular solute-binding protein [Candidatus Nitrosotalea sp.]
MGWGARLGSGGLACLWVTMTIAGCGPAAHGARVVAGASAARRSGTADVAYAGSLQLLMESKLGPNFSARSGYAYRGRGAGSFALAREIESGEIAPNVFASVGPAPITQLEPKLTRWYVQIASSPIVVVYNPQSRFAPVLSAVAHGQRPLADLFSVLAQRGFMLGRTNPDTDPQGQAFYEMVELAQSSLQLPAGSVTRILGALDNPAQVFEETALEARLQAGQLDAASAYLSQAVQLHLPYIALPATLNFGNPAAAAAYAGASLRLSNGTTVHGAPLVVDVTQLTGTDAAAAAAFVAYLLSPAARASFKAAGYQLLTPALFGDGARVPAEVRHEIPS